MKNTYKKLNAQHFSLGELVALVGSCAKNSQETVAALQDLFQSGRVRLKNGGRFKRVRLSA